MRSHHEKLQKTGIPRDSSGTTGSKTETCVKEKYILKAIVHVLHILECANQLVFIRPDSTGKLATNRFGGLKFIPNPNIRGCSDLIILLPSGIDLFVEVKSAIGTQRESQKIFQDKINRIGGARIYAIVRSVEEFLRLLSTHGVVV